MSNFSSTNLCPRCNKPRIEGKTWSEKVTTLSGVSVVLHTMTICSDPECQKVVEKNLAIEKAKSDQIKKAFEERAAEKKKQREAKKKAK